MVLARLADGGVEVERFAQDLRNFDGVRLVSKGKAQVVARQTVPDG